MRLALPSLESPSLVRHRALPHPTAHVESPAAPPSWQDLLPALEAELESDLAAFRKSLRAARILPDWINPDVFPRSKSGAWQVYADDRTVDGVRRHYTLYVRRSSAQFAVNEDGGLPYVVTSTFTSDFPWDPPTADEVREAMVVRMRSLGLLTR